ncbi:MAG: GLPGLI family protein [Flavobacteriaceae bacterium]|nr:GLPGLI family protein [Flavobacteriaceae bacterium]
MNYRAIKIVLSIFYLSIITNLYAQTTYKVTYYIAEIKLQGSIDNLDEKGKHFTEQVIDYSKDVNYILIANQDASYFESEDILRKENNSPLEDILLRMAKRFTSFNKNVYANHKEDSIVFVRNLVNQDFTVKRDYFNFNWILKEETKKILGFDAIKAEGNYFDLIINKKLKVEAWFIPSIPLQSGPDVFMGLPGLIAEVNLNGAVVKIKDIVSEQGLVIKLPNITKPLTQKEYESLIENLTKKIKDYADN